MNPYTIIEKKQQGKSLSADELAFMINGFVKGNIPDYQMSALLMAIFFRDMTESEVSALIQIIIDSGKRVHFPDTGVYYADKHSTGGVGDKVSLILAPLVASTGLLKIPMISGRGLGHSGGTLDKLDSIPGFNSYLNFDQFMAQTDKIGCALIGQTGEICPADKKLYALRDVTATVRSIPIICGSILSKKIAEGINGLVLDVKTGNGAFMQRYEDSLKLGKALKRHGEAFGLQVKALITNMHQPLGYMVGNWLEVLESLDLLQNRGPADLRELTIELSAEMLQLAEPDVSITEHRQLLENNLAKGKAMEKFLEIVHTQGGNVKVLENPASYPHKAKYILDVRATESGFISDIDTYMLGIDAISLGAGRQKSSDSIEPEAGFRIHIEYAQKVSRGDLLFTLYSSRKEAIEKLQKDIEQRITYSDNLPKS
ncbi:MAG TPA: thymidine phosphorylase, partial [Candidatus Marinimicrobia bacterium]|nr:thymidine phosphorylase [Candidatus Neomarinimicrobiota bacterium]